MLFLFNKAGAGPAAISISPFKELGAYEALWLEAGGNFKSIAERVEKDPTALPSDFVSAGAAANCAAEALSAFKKRGVHRFGVRVHHAGDYPVKLRDAQHPVELLYYQGSWELTETRSIAIVGSRKPSEAGLERTRRIAKESVESRFTVVSGLATGIDRAAHQAAIDNKGATIAVLGTPLGVYYPKENEDLQKRIAEEFLVISQVPMLRYLRQHPPQNKFFFPARNVTMSALTEATVIVEASDTSGTLIQARAALQQKRKLFILDSCFERKDISWPAKYEAQGAIRVKKSSDIWDALG